MAEPLWVLEGICDGRPFRLEFDAGPRMIGREADDRFRLPALSVSRRHAEICADAEALTIRDLGSRNGTWVNGRQIEGPVLLVPGDVVRLGEVEARVGRPGAEPADTDRVPLIRDSGGILAAADELATSFRLPRAAALSASAAALSGAERRLLEAVLEAGPLLAEERAPAAVFEAVVDLVARVVPARRVLVLTREGAEEEPQVRAARPPLGPGQTIMLSRAMIHEVLETRESLLVTDARLDERFRDRGSVFAQEIRAALVAPLFDNERAIGLVYLDSSDPSVVYGQDQLRALTLLANLVAVKITTSRLQEANRAKERMEAELATAARIQASLLPAVLPETPGYEIAAHQTPCWEVGGDLYEVLALPDGRRAVVVGDVTGKGTGAALLMANLLAALRVLLEQDAPLLEMARRINHQMVLATDPVHFATLFVGLLDPRDHSLSYFNAGYNPPLLVSPGGVVRRLEATGLPVGMIDGLPYEERRTGLDPGDLLCLYSDGIPEAETAGEFFGEERLEAILRAGTGRGAAVLAEELLGAVAAFLAGGRPADDVTLVLLRRLP